MSARVSIIVPVYNKAGVLVAAMDSIVAAAAEYPETEIICVDNGSTDGSRQLLDRYASVATLIDSTATTISAVRNQGARAAHGDYLVFFDADVLVPAGYVSRMLQAYASVGAAAIGCEYALPPDPVWVERVWYELNVREDDGDRRYINGGDFVVRRDAFDAVGGWPEYLATSEDYEFCRLLVRNGYRVYQAQAITVAHLGNPKTLREFTGKMRWHGLGMLRARAAGDRLNLPTIMTLIHVALLAMAVLVVVLPTPLTWTVRAAIAAAAVMLVPLGTYTFRLRQVRRFVAPLPALVLLHAFFLGRASAMLANVRSDHRDRSPTPAPTPIAR